MILFAHGIVGRADLPIPVSMFAVAAAAVLVISFVALVALLNGILGWGHSHVAFIPANIQTVLGFLFRPIAWVMGVPWVDTATIGGLLGTRMVLNEFVAFAKLGQPGVGSSLDPRSFVITTYALCGFANFSSIAIQKSTS